MRLIGLTVLMIIASCRSVDVVELVRSDMRHSEIVRIDTVRIKDSVFVNTFTKGDTVYREIIKVVYRDRINIKRDTVYVTKENTQEIPTPTEREPSVWERIGAMFKEARWLIIAAVVAYVTYRIFRRKTPQ